MIGYQRIKHKRLIHVQTSMNAEVYLDMLKFYSEVRKWKSQISQILVYDRLPCLSLDQHLGSKKIFKIFIIYNNIDRKC